MPTPTASMPGQDTAACAPPSGARVTLATGMVSLAVGAVVLFSWEFDLQAFMRVLPGFVAMNPSTAIAFALAGLALVWGSQASRMGWGLRCAALAICAIGILKLSDIMLGTRFEVDNFLLALSLGKNGAASLSSLAPNTAINLVMVGLALFLLPSRRRAFQILAQTCTLLALLLAVMMIIGYAYGTLGLYHMGHPMSLSSAVTFLAVTVGLLWMRPDFGATAVLTSRNLGGSTARRLLPWLIGLPFLLGLVLVYGMLRHLDPVSSTALFVVAIICVLVAITAAAAIRLDRLSLNLAAHAAALEKATRAADFANLAKSNFLANMSHEMRTPMNGVLGMLEILGHTKLNAEQNRIVGTIRTSAQTLLQILNDILDFSKIEADRLTIENIPTDLTEVIENTAKLFLGAAMAKGIAIRCFVGANVRGQFLTDPVRFQQILGNLVSNAIKFTSRGTITITADLEGETLRIEVQDTGIGISPQVQARLFKPFVQADDSTARKFGGTGLGLSICMHLSRLMKGKLTMGSVEGEGTRITLLLPTPRVAGSDARPEFDLKGVKVAVIGRDEVERNHLKGCLAYWGAEVRAMALTDPALMDGGHGIILAPLADEADVRLLAGQMPPSLTPQRFVFFAFDNEPADQQSPARDAIRTIALSRARIVTAVAVAAGVVSPEVETVHQIAQMENRGAPPDREQALRNGWLILLAEDHPLNRDVIVWQLQLLGYAVDAVESGVAALAAMEKTRYGLVLTDCNMPEMDGFELTRRIRAEGDAIPIVALTANAMVGEAEKCLAAGMDDFLSKPVDMPRLRACLEKWLPGSSAHPAIAAAPAAPQSDVLDLALLEECFGGDQEMIRKNLTLFLDAMQADLETLSDAIARNDRQETELTAHRIKGAARFVGGTQLAAASQAIEALADQQDWPGIARDWEQLVAASAEIRAHIERQFAA